MFFAQLRSLTGMESVEIEADNVGAADLWRLLEERWPALSGHRATTRLARNGSYAEAGALFRAGDEVALIPPVSGG